MLTPILAMVIWTLIVWLWMYSLRIPAMQKAGIDPQSAQHPSSLDSLPANVRSAADNYNHLHEAPTVFYALAVYVHLAGATDQVSVFLAWGFVALRVLHSFAQIVLRNVMARFSLFVLSTLCLIIIAVRALLAL